MVFFTPNLSQITIVILGYFSYDFQAELLQI